ncbi:MAG: metal-sensitive transcriptional regulator [Dehalococcoidia bacterium]|nr:metal-sensitive transcriptional regulator [Dehalococcoidia bacterium]
MAHDDDKKLQDRLARVEGQVRGLRKMLEEDRACEDVLNQLLAARSGLEQAGLLILDRHLQACILAGVEIPEQQMEQLRRTLRLWSRHSTHGD